MFVAHGNYFGTKAQKKANLMRKVARGSRQVARAREGAGDLKHRCRVRGGTGTIQGGRGEEDRAVSSVEDNKSGMLDGWWR